MSGTLLDRLEQDARNVRAGLEVNDLDSVNISLDELKTTIDLIEAAVDENGLDGLREEDDG